MMARPSERRLNRIWMAGVIGSDSSEVMNMFLNLEKR
jgi:hypothetical protein